jgi:hypothetical protein
MDARSKKTAVLKLFGCYPSMAGLSEAQVAVLLASYLDLLREFSDATVEVACRGLGKSAGGFAPSAGDLYQACARLKDVDAARKRVPGITDDRLEAIARGDQSAPAHIAFMTSLPASKF